MQDKIKTISLRDISWDDVKNHANGVGFKDLSPYIEYCIGKDMYKTKSTRRSLIILWVGVYLILALILIILITGRL